MILTGAPISPAHSHEQGLYPLEDSPCCRIYSECWHLRSDLSKNWTNSNSSSFFLRTYRLLDILLLFLVLTPTVILSSPQSGLLRLTPLWCPDSPQLDIFLRVKDLPPLDCTLSEMESILGIWSRSQWLEITPPARQLWLPIHPFHPL